MGRYERGGKSQDPARWWTQGRAVRRERGRTGSLDDGGRGEHGRVVGEGALARRTVAAGAGEVVGVGRQLQRRVVGWQAGERQAEAVHAQHRHTHGRPCGDDSLAGRNGQRQLLLGQGPCAAEGRGRHAARRELQPRVGQAAEARQVQADAVVGPERRAERKAEPEGHLAARKAGVVGERGRAEAHTRGGRDGHGLRDGPGLRGERGREAGVVVHHAGDRQAQAQRRPDEQRHLKRATRRRRKLGEDEHQEQVILGVTRPHSYGLSIC